MTYTEFIEKIKAKAHEELHYSYDILSRSDAGSRNRNFCNANYIT